MAYVAICRVCLVRNTKMYSLRNTGLQTTFELFTSIKLNMADGKPEMLCYICYSHLKKCSKFRDVCHNSEKILTQFILKGYALTTNTVKMLDGATPTLLSTSQIQHSSLGDSMDPDVFVKQEQAESSDYIETDERYDVKTEATKVRNETQTISRSLEIVLEEIKAETITPNTEEVFVETSKNKTTSKLIITDNDDNTKETENENGTKNSCYPCEQCSKSFVLKCRLKRHMRTHAGEKPYSCNKCGKKYSSAAHVQNHLETHAGNKENVCEICGKKFFESSNLKRHLKLHTDTPITCNLCDKTFKSNNNLREHKKLHSGGKPHICEICSKAFAKKSVLLIHVRTHTGEKPYACLKCGKTFIMSRNLNGHIHRMHTDVKPYACEICGKTFAEGTYLKRHMRIHTGEKPYSCKMCDKSFAYYTNMKTHVLTHTGETPYSCDRCGKAFTQASSMKQHIQIVHSRAKPYGCEVCTKTYSKRSNLQIHMRSHTGERPYSCEKCNKSFGRREQFKRHLKIHMRTSVS